MRCLGVGARPHLLDALVGVQDHVDGDVAVGVDPDLPVRAVGALHDLVDLLLAHGQDAVVVGAADVRGAHAHGPLRRRAVGTVLDPAYAQPLVTETGRNARLAQAVVRST